MSLHPQDALHAASLSHPETFWAAQAARLHWHKKPTTILQKYTKTLPQSGTAHDHWAWFPDGDISTCYNCLDRHVLAGQGHQPAILYDSPVTSDTRQRITYAQLLDDVQVFASVLRDEGGVQKGDVVLVYMPMIPAVLTGLLAISRLGALHAVVFGGFAPQALAQRIDASRPKVILTASCGIDGNKPPIPYREYLEEAERLATWRTPRTLVWQRPQLEWHPLRKEAGERSWNRLVRSAALRGRRVTECVPVKGTDGVYVIYTSGTTGLPKGVVREAGGHAVGLEVSMRQMFGLQGPGDVLACFSDIGWVVSHSYTLYGPLLVGAATVLYEGKPVGTPDPSAFWRMVQEYKVNAIFTAPTALRAIRRDDPDNKHLRRIGEQGGLRSLRALFLAGERSEPAIVTTYQDLLARYGDQRLVGGARVVDNWWSSESGSPISGISMAPQAVVDFEDKSTTTAKEARQFPPPLDIKPGSAGKPMPGFDVRVVDDEGNELAKGKMGNIVLKMPLAPTAFRTLWEDEERFYKGYLKRFEGRWLDTGDAGIVDLDGYIHIMARSDDIINVAAHRLSTGTLEQAITSHPHVTEACVVGIPDQMKGQLPFAFVQTSASCPLDDSKLLSEIQQLVRTQVGPIASLGGMIRTRSGGGGGGGAKPIIPKTRSGKTLRRVLRELLENGVHGEFDKAVSVPSTVEDASVVDAAARAVRVYFESRGGDVHKAIEGRAKL
ncbi:acetyl-CoA synthetase-like protein [Cryphonectria parasitica EP155]|uniref:Acetyl-CoA synthetase-like protein n=1 Tax=Cryphonectria parasitica (strain ATCC 38755 / EP155) TaxID=660469 RepID=A0A9P5CJL1_CRYP1|nr:acetyl-CoA synthetase-like protein [Cryphonectria parasitica EP155]KAF3761118.1 acetyl-CoA synthetase-like protein [Cryphonectria parasitica EP155]